MARHLEKGFTARFTHNEFYHIKRAAYDAHRTVSDYVRRAVLMAVRNGTVSPAPPPVQAEPPIRPAGKLIVKKSR